MEIKIDTKKDSVDDIKKMISFLQKFIDETPSYGTQDNSNDEFNIPATGMFDTPIQKEETNDDSVRIVEY